MIEIIDLLKPKNGGSFKLIEDIDIAVNGYSSLADCVAHMATTAMIDAINAVMAGKANASDVATAESNLQNQINQIVISSSAESVVAPEVAAARVGADGTSYLTLKNRLDAENLDILADISHDRAEFGLKNVFDTSDNDILRGKYIDSSGTEVTNSNYAETGYIGCRNKDKMIIVSHTLDANGDKIHIAHTSLVFTIYNAEKELIGSGMTGADFVEINNSEAAFIRCAIPNRYQNVAIYCSNIGALDLIPDDKPDYYSTVNSLLNKQEKELYNITSQGKNPISRKNGNLPNGAYIIDNAYIDTNSGELFSSGALSTLICPYTPNTMMIVINCKNCFSIPQFQTEYVIRYRTQQGVIGQTTLLSDVSLTAIQNNSDNLTFIVNDDTVKDIIITASNAYIDNISIISSDNASETMDNKIPENLIELYNSVPSNKNLLESSKMLGKLSLYKTPNSDVWHVYYGTGSDESAIKAYGLYKLRKGETITVYGSPDQYVSGYVLSQDLEISFDLAIGSGTNTSSYTATEDSYLILSGNDQTDTTKFIITKPDYVGRIPLYAIEGNNFGSQWYGKKWCALGTSLTSTSWGRYSSRLAALSGMQEVNLGVPNGIIGPLEHSSERPSIMAQIANVPVDSDLITLEGFVNDWEEAADFGAFGDTTADTFCGALYVALNALTQVSNALVVGLTMPTGINTCNPYYKNRLNKYQYEYNDIFIKTCRAFGVPVIECDKCGVNVNTASLYLRDSIHHTDLGGQLIANYIWKQLERMDNKLLSL